MVNLKGADKSDSMAMPYSPPEYPCGMVLHLDHGVLERLGIEELPEVGKEIVFKAKAVVAGTNENKSEGHECRSMRLQITDIALGKEKSSKEATKALYNEES